MKGPLATLALLLALAPAAWAATFRGTVTHVTDGDTLWVRPDPGGAPVRLRLMGLDAPEVCQAFGPQAAEALRARVLRQPVTVRTHGSDDYGRQLARVQHRREDLGRWLVRHGFAWSAGLHGRTGPYAREQALALGEHRGLWAAAAPLEPRSFRRRFGSCHP